MDEESFSLTGHQGTDSPHSVRGRAGSEGQLWSSAPASAPPRATSTTDGVLAQAKGSFSVTLAQVKEENNPGQLARGKYSG